MQFPNPILRYLVIFDSNGNPVIILGPGPVFKVINPVTGAELDIDAGANFPEILFWNSAHTFFGKMSLEVSALSTRQMLLMTSPPDQSFAIPGNPDVQPRLFMTSAIQLGNVLPIGSTNNVGGQLYLDDGAMSVSVFDGNNPSGFFISLQALIGDPAAGKADLVFLSGKATATNPLGNRFVYDTGYFATTDAANFGWTVITLMNGWATNPNWTPLQWKLLPDGNVIIRGSIAGGVVANATKINAAISVLPVQARPKTTGATTDDMIIPIVTATAPAAGGFSPGLQVTQAGDLFIYGAGATGPLFIDGIWATL